MVDEGAPSNYSFTLQSKVSFTLFPITQNINSGVSQLLYSKNHRPHVAAARRGIID